MNLNGVEQ